MTLYWANRVLGSFKWIVAIALLVVVPLMFLFIAPHPKGGPKANLPGALLFAAAVIVLIVTARGVNLFFTNQPRTALVSRVPASLAFTARPTGSSYRWLTQQLPSPGLSAWVATSPICVLATNEGAELYAVSALHTPERLCLLAWRDIHDISTGGTWLTRNHIQISPKGELGALRLAVEQDSLIPERGKAIRIAAGLRSGWLHAQAKEQ